MKFGKIFVGNLNTETRSCNKTDNQTQTAKKRKIEYMPFLTASAENVEGKPPLDAGIYEFQCTGFAPKYSSKGDSVNMNPVFKIINHASRNGDRIFENGNTLAGWVNKNWCAALGYPLQKDETTGAYNYPIEFSDTSNPGIEKATVQSPLIGLTGACVLKVVQARDRNQQPVVNTDGTPKMRNEVESYLPKA